MKYKLQTEKFIPGKTRITYGAVLFGQEERTAIEAVLDRNWWAINGEGELFEKELAVYVGKKYCILTNSGSSALLLAVNSLPLARGAGIAIPAVTFPTAFNVIVQNGYTPYVIDVEKNSLALSIGELEQAFKMGARAVIAVHIVGYPVDMEKIMDLAKKYKSIVIEDNCDGLGGNLNSRKLGSFGDISCISMYAGHIINMGEGGAVFTNDKKIAQKVRSMRDWGRAEEADTKKSYSGLPSDYPARYIYTEIGYNLRPLELQAAMGRVQLRKIESIKQARQNNFGKLKRIFQTRPGITIIESPKNSSPCWFSFPIFTEKREKLIKFLEKHNIETRPIFAGNILRQPAYKNIKVHKISNLLNAEEVLCKGLFIGLHPLISDEAFVYINKVVDEFFSGKHL